MSSAIGQCPWLVSYKDTDDPTGNFFWFCPKWRAVFEVKAWEKRFAEVVYRYKKWKGKRVIMLKLEKHHPMKDPQSLIFKMFTRLFCLQRVKALKIYWNNLFTSRKKKKKKPKRTMVLVT